MNQQTPEKDNFVLYLSCTKKFGQNANSDFLQIFMPETEIWYRICTFSKKYEYIDAQSICIINSIKIQLTT